MRRQGLAPLAALLLVIGLVGVLAGGINSFSRLDCGDARPAVSQRCTDQVAEATKSGSVAQVALAATCAAVFIYRRVRARPPLNWPVWAAFIVASLVIALVAQNATRHAVSDQYSIQVPTGA